MIKFFRNIRQSLLSKNKIRNYLMYAVGEIALVVVGILIALQINTWNEERRDRKAEHQILLNLLSDLKSNEVILKDAELSIDIQVEQTKLMLGLMQENPTDSAIKQVYQYLYEGTEVEDVQLRLSGIEGIIDTKLDLIRNESLKQLLVEYPVLFAGYKNQETLMVELKQNRIRPAIKNHIFLENVASGSTKFSSDVRGLLSDRLLANHLTDRKWESAEWKQNLKSLRTHGLNLIEMIEKEFDLNQK